MLSSFLVAPLALREQPAAARKEFLRSLPGDLRPRLQIVASPGESRHSRGRLCHTILVVFQSRGRVLLHWQSQARAAAPQQAKNGLTRHPRLRKSGAIGSPGAEDPGPALHIPIK